jgi:DNA-binding transcriptional LysR family regulator
LIPISDLEIFARVVTAGNMSAAGRELGLSPAVISKRIGHLERRLGVRLFQRTTRQIRLTETGEGFYQRITDVLRGIQDAEAFASQGNDHPTGILRVGAPSSFARGHVAPFLGQFLDAYPDLQVELTVSDAGMDVVGDGLDVCIHVGELDDSSLVAKKLAPCRKVLCAAPDYLARVGVPETLSDLDKVNCISTVDNRAWRLQGPDGPKTVRAAGHVRTNSSDVVREAIVGGAGIGFRAVWDIAAHLRRGELVALMPEYGEAPGVAIYAVYPCREFVPAKQRVFLDFLENAYANIAFDAPDIEKYTCRPTAPRAVAAT